MTAIDAPAAAGRALALELYDAAVAAAAPGPATARAVDALAIERGSRLWIFAFGKAARPMAAAAVQSTLRSLHSIVGGLIVSQALTLFTTPVVYLAFDRLAKRFRGAAVVGTTQVGAPAD